MCAFLGGWALDTRERTAVCGGKFVRGKSSCGRREKKEKEKGGRGGGSGQRGRHKMPPFIMFHSACSDISDDKWDLTYQSTSGPRDMEGIKSAAAGPSAD